MKVMLLKALKIVCKKSEEYVGSITRLIDWFNEH